MVRTVAFTLVPAALLALGCCRAIPWKKRALWSGVIIAAWVMVGGGWMLRNQIVSAAGDLTYMDKALAGEPMNSLYWLALDQRLPLLAAPRRAAPADIMARALSNLNFYARQPLYNAWPAGAARASGISLAASAPAALLLLIGLLRGLFQKRRLLDFYVFIYLAVLIFYPHQDTRFLIPVMPFLILYAVEALEPGARFFFRGEGRTRAAGRIAGLVLSAVLILIFSYRDFRHCSGIHYDTPVIVRGPYFRVTTPHLGAYHSAVLLDWVRKNSSPTDRVLFHSYAACAVMTEKQCAGIPLVDPARLIKFLDDAGITLVVVDDEAKYGPAYTSAFTPRFLVPAIEAFPDRFQSLMTLDNSSARVWRVVRN